MLKTTGLKYLYNLVIKKDWYDISQRSISASELCWKYNTELYKQLVKSGKINIVPQI